MGGEDGSGRSAGEQAIVQLASLFMTMAVAVLSGLICGAIMNVRALCDPLDDDSLFDDALFFNLPDGVDPANEGVNGEVLMSKEDKEDNDNHTIVRRSFSRGNTPLHSNAVDFPNAVERSSAHHQGLVMNPRILLNSATASPPLMVPDANGKRYCCVLISLATGKEPLRWGFN